MTLTTWRAVRTYEKPVTDVLGIIPRDRVGAQTLDNSEGDRAQKLDSYGETASREFTRS